MTSPLLRDCLDDAKRLLITRGGDRFSVRDLWADVDDLREKLRVQGSRSLLIHTDHPASILSGLLLHEEDETPLLLAHAYLPAGEVESLARQLHFESVRRIDGSVDGSSEVGTGPIAAGVYMMTSGTSGTPKIARHVLASMVGRITPKTGVRGDTRWLLTYSPTTFAGLQVLLTSVLTGAVLIAPSSMDLVDVLSEVKDCRPTHISGTPTFWRSLLLSLQRDETVDYIQQVTLGGEAVDQALLDRIARALPNANITQIYATTEAGVLFSVQDRRAGFPVEWLESGVTPHGVQLKVIDAILHIKSPHRMQGYSSEHENPTDESGWTSTGDLVKICEDRVFFAGRADGVLKVAGAKVSPLEVETEILKVPGVVDARVFLRSNPITGNVLSCEIVRDPAHGGQNLEDDVWSHCHRVFPSFKIPRHIRVVDEIQRTWAGKRKR